MAESLAKEIISQSSDLQERVVELEGQVSSLKSRLDIMERGKKPHEDWEYSAPVPSTEELEAMGYEEELDDGAEFVEDLLGQFETTATNLRWGACESVSIGDNSCEDSVVTYNDFFLPHWRELADALSFLKDGDVLKDFSLMNIELPRHIVVLLKNSLRGKKLQIECLRFEGVKFGGTDLFDRTDFAADLLSTCTVNTFRFENIAIDYHFELNRLCDAINKSSSSLRQVGLACCNNVQTVPGGGNAEMVGYNLLCSILENNKELDEVSFKAMKVMIPENDERLSDLLRESPKLHVLDLSNYIFPEKAWNKVDEHMSHVFGVIFEKNSDLQIHVGSFFGKYHTYHAKGKKPMRPF